MILVTGGAGYIGSTLVGMLLNQGYSIRVLDSLLHGGTSLIAYFNHPCFEFMSGDILDTGTIARALEGVETVVHLAAIVGEPACNRDTEHATEVNLNATKQIVDLACDTGVQRFIFSSTCSNYGVKSEDEICVETTLVNPVSVYAQSKVAAEQYLLSKASLATPTVLRFSTVFGVSGRMRFDLLINDFVKTGLKDRKIEIYNADSWRPYLHVRDICRAIVMVMEASPRLVSREIFNVGSNEMNYRKREIFEFVKDLIPELEYVDIGAGPDIRSYRVSFNKIETTLGFRPTVDVSQGIEEIYELLISGLLAKQDPDEHYN